MTMSGNSVQCSVRQSPVLSKGTGWMASFLSDDPVLSTNSAIIGEKDLEKNETKIENTILFLRGKERGHGTSPFLSMGSMEG